MTSQIVCREVVELVTDFLEDALPADERRRVEDHLRHCHGCTAYLAQVRLTIAATGELPAPLPDPEVREALLAAFRAARPG